MLQSAQEKPVGAVASAPVAPARRWIRIIAGIAVPWNLIGVGMFLSHVGLLGAGGTPPGGAEMPALVTVAYGIGTITGLVGSIGLAMLRRWSRMVLWVSAVALIIDWGWVLGVSGAGNVAIGGTVLFVAGLLVVLAEMAERRSLLG
ncbi:MAG TPA: hypothetical protein VE861_11900 [Gemmatimonadaceae bacterium]|nr:hypothetical protein [Gemmatimonadaceae bacterium]